MDAIDPFQTESSGGGSATLSPKQIFAILWAYRRAIVIVPLLIGLAAGLYIKFAIPKNYLAAATLLVAFKADDPTSGGDFSQLGNWSFIPTQIEFIQSPSTLMPVVEELKLYQLPEYTAGYRGDGSPESIRQYAVWALKKKLKVNSGNQSRFIYVAAEDKNPVMAATLANAVTDAYVDAQMKQFLDPAKERLRRYTEQLDTLRKNIDIAQAKVAEFRKRTGLVNVAGGDSESARLIDLESRLADATAARQQAELQLARGRQGDAAVVNSTLVQSLKGQLQAREAKMVELRASLGPRHPDILALQGEMNELREQYNRESSVHVASAAAELAAARAVESKLSAQIAEQRQQVMAVRSHQDEGASLQHELDSATKVYQSALDAVERAQLATQMAVSTVNVVNRASPPSAPMGTRRKLFIVAFAGGLFATIGACVLWELLHRRVRCREDVEHDLRTTVLVELRSPA
jgi:polysaccharide biosynthesis transport protein